MSPRATYMSGMVTMQHVSVWVRRIATTILIPIFTAVAARFIWEQPPETAAGAAFRFFLSVAEQTWLRVTALLLVGFVAGLWVDGLLRKLDRFRAKARENLGIEMTNLAHDMERVQRPLQAFSPELLSAFIKAKQVGLWTPDFGMNPNDITYYLSFVGKLLSAGHFAEAKQAAQTMAENVKRAK